MRVNLKILNKTFLIVLMLFASIAFGSENFADSDLKLAKITPSDVFTEALKVEAEVAILKEHFGIKSPKIAYVSVKGDFKPKHVWQLGYTLNVKLNILRVQLNLPRIEEIGRAPVSEVFPNLPYGMMVRLQAEIQILKRFLGITKKIAKIERVRGKSAPDVFNKLLQISKEMNYLNRQGVDASAVFAQVMRVYHDTTTILDILNIIDNTVPPKKNEDSKPIDSFINAQKLMKHIKKLQIK